MNANIPPHARPSVGKTTATTKLLRAVMINRATPKKDIAIAYRKVTTQANFTNFYAIHSAASYMQ